jgi:Asp-tRNA(Asn)/Glu-tRNA(Gln) amidotransferase A subunit family amidase
MTTTEAARLIARGELGAEALVRKCLEHIDAREAEIGAWETLDREGALKQARICDRSPQRGLLHGIPIGVKDIIDVAGLPTRHGSPIYANNIAASDAACVALAKAAGAIVLGKTVTTELAVFYPGKTRNPRAPGHTPGGSSSGSAAAVAAHMVPLALGTQTAGSVIRPASFCGVVGFKPTFGLIARAGAKLQSDTLDTVGIFANNVEDAALFAAVLSGDESLMVRVDALHHPQVGVCKTHEWPHADEDAQRAIESAVQCFTRAGAQTTSIDLPEAFAQLAAAQQDIQLFEIARSYAFEYESHRDRLSARLATMLDEGRAIPWLRYRAALELAARCRVLIADVFRDVDVLLMPSAPGAAPNGLESTGDPVFNRLGTVLHLPCITLPGFNAANGLPVGVQLLGPVWRDARTLQAAAWAERALDA